jgi:hypothetical protein
MRWIKHMTAARSDKAMALVSERHGPIAIGIYWGIVEEIAGPMEPGKMTPSASHSVAKWASILDTSSRTFTKICKSLQTESLIFCETIEDRLTISVPNILKYKDEYSQRSGQTPAQEQKQSRTDTEQSKHPLPPQGDELVLAATEPATPKRAKPPNAYDTMTVDQHRWFNEFWSIYPHRKTDNRLTVAGVFKGYAVDLESWELIHLALVKHVSIPDEPAYAKGAAVWLHAEPWKYDMPTNGNGSQAPAPVMSRYKPAPSIFDPKPKGPTA